MTRWRRDRLPTPVFLDFPGGSDGKESACNAGDLGSIPGSERSPGGGQGKLLQCPRLENPHGQRSREGCSPRGHKESDTTERLDTAQHVYVHVYTCISYAKGFVGHYVSSPLFSQKLILIIGMVVDY